KVLVAGGRYPYLSSVELYDPATGTWTNIVVMHALRAGHTATLLPNGGLLVAAGSEWDYSQLSSAELYDPVAKSWAVTTSMFAQRTYYTSTVLPNGSVLLVGGWFWGGPNGTYLSSAELYVSPAPITV